MSEPIEIRSSDGNGVLRIDLDSVSIKSHEYSGYTSVYDLHSPQLLNFFDSLARDWKGWDGKKEYGSLEGEFGISAISDPTGHAHLTVTLRSNLRWQLEASLVIDAGDLDRIASEVRRLGEK